MYHTWHVLEIMKLLSKLTLKYLNYSIISFYIDFAFDINAYLCSLQQLFQLQKQVFNARKYWEYLLQVKSHVTPRCVSDSISQSFI